MRGRAFLNTARRLVSSKAEEDWRTAAGRAYYALMQEGNDALGRWGIKPHPRENVHMFVRLRFTYGANKDVTGIGNKLDALVRLRNEADYQLGVPGRFATGKAAGQAVVDAEAGIDLLDQIEADPVRRAAVIATINAEWP
jgi:hypothetical protein